MELLFFLFVGFIVFVLGGGKSSGNCGKVPHNTLWRMRK